jgi:hypothetical protein
MFNYKIRSKSVAICTENIRNFFLLAEIAHTIPIKACILESKPNILFPADSRCLPGTSQMPSRITLLHRFNDSSFVSGHEFFAMKVQLSLPHRSDLC